VHLLQPRLLQKLLLDLHVAEHAQAGAGEQYQTVAREAQNRVLIAERQHSGVLEWLIRRPHLVMPQQLNLEVSGAI
jgi:hypothetical protein